MNFTALVTACCALHGAVLCQDLSQGPGSAKPDLEPLESALTYHTPAYHAKLRELLFGRAPGFSDVQFLVLPSFDRETLASIAEVEDGFELSVVRPEEQIWYHEGKVNEIRCEVVKKGVPRTLVDPLRKVWRAMLLRTRYQDSNGVILDGVGYVFLSYERGVGHRGGRTHSPTPGTRAHALVEIGRLLVAFADAEPAAEEAMLSKMSQRIDDLESELAAASDSADGPGEKKQ